MGVDVGETFFLLLLVQFTPTHPIDILFSTESCFDLLFVRLRRGGSDVAHDGFVEESSVLWKMLAALGIRRGLFFFEMTV